MIDVDEKQKGDNIWIVRQDISEMIYPEIVQFHSKESPTGRKLAFINYRQKRVCYPTNLLFENKEDAELYAATSFIKMYYSFDPFTISEDIDEATLMEAHRILEYYEEHYPHKFLYYWMANVPNR